VPVFVLVLIVAVVVVAVAAAVLFARRSHDDEHSVEGYHRQLHTLEVLRTHQPGGPTEGENEATPAFPESALRVTPRPTVRLTEPGKAIVPPVPPPPVANPDKPVTFDDAGPVVSTPAPSSGKGWQDDKALHGIDHRPRRLAAPAAAVAAVTVLIVVLIVAGFHNNPAPPHHGRSTTTTHASAKATVTTKARTTTGSHHHARHSTTTTTLADTAFVSLPKATSDYAANYTVQSSSYTLVMSATSAGCWVDATEKATGTVLFTGVINPGQTQTVTGSGEVSLVVGAPDYFTATLNGSAVSFPFGFLSPFTMDFKPSPHAGLSS